MNPFVIAFRRIIYSIPLKRLLLGLAIFGVLLATFSNASYNNLGGGNLQLNPNQIAGGFGTTNQYAIGSDTFCMVNSSSSVCNFTVSQGNNSVTIDEGRMIGCLTGITISSSVGLTVKNNVDSSCTARTLFFSTSDFRPEYTSLECQTEYNLIPVESVDSNYCQSNNLCPSCPVCPDIPVFSGDLSELYINNILHVGAPTIVMNIPEEIDWDYAYTMGGNIMNIDVVGYNQDFEKIEGWIETNNYKPTSEDFTNLFTGGFSNFGGLLIATLFVILVFYFVKKMFK